MHRMITYNQANELEIAEGKAGLRNAYAPYLPDL